MTDERTPLIRVAIEIASKETDFSQITWKQVTQRCHATSGFIFAGGDAGNSLLLRPFFDSKNVYQIDFTSDDESTLETKTVTMAPDLFLIWWNSPKDLERLKLGTIDAYIESKFEGQPRSTIAQVKEFMAEHGIAD